MQQNYRLHDDGRLERLTWDPAAHKFTAEADITSAFRAHLVERRMSVGGFHAKFAFAAANDDEAFEQALRNAKSVTRIISSSPLERTEGAGSPEQPEREQQDAAAANRAEVQRGWDAAIASVNAQWKARKG